MVTFVAGSLRVPKPPSPCWTRFSVTCFSVSSISLANEASRLTETPPQITAADTELSVPLFGELRSQRRFECVDFVFVEFLIRNFEVAFAADSEELQQVVAVFVRA